MGVCCRHVCKSAALPGSVCSEGGGDGGGVVVWCCVAVVWCGGGCGVVDQAALTEKIEANICLVYKLNYLIDARYLM